MNRLVDRLAEVIQDANEKAPYIVKAVVDNKYIVSYWGVFNSNILVSKWNDLEAAEEACESLNYRFMAEFILDHYGAK